MIQTYVLNEIYEGILAIIKIDDRNLIKACKQVATNNQIDCDIVEKFSIICNLNAKCHKENKKKNYQNLFESKTLVHISLHLCLLKR